MYSTCLFCQHDLGKNDVIERFPVGRRLAFDGSKGRLWVVCRRCGRWNLTPIEERWEAIEECERMFRSTKLRVSTDEIGLAKVREGLELVRIGEPQRPEFAAWRYGDQFGKRRVRMLVGVGASVAVGGVMLATGSIAALKAVIPGGGLLYQIPNFINMYRHHKVVVARVTVGRGREASIRLKHMPKAELLRTDNGWLLRVEHDDGFTDLQGADALRVAGRLLARINHAGAFKSTVQQAVGRLEDHSSPDAFIASIAKGRATAPRLPSRVHDLVNPAGWNWHSGSKTSDSAPTLRRLSTVDRLALEMATHEESEQRALAGELAALADEWRDAEEIAGIADNLLVPAEAAKFVERHRRK